MIYIEHMNEVMQIPGVDPEFFVSVIPELILSENKQCGEISLVFCSDEYLLDLNNKHLQHDYYTDILTFEHLDNEGVSGDLFISIDRVIDNAELLTVEPRIELCRVVFHGVLHLLGYSDKTVKQNQINRCFT
ncbi:MAG: rRNA maturation RNase YbeY [Bacteroidota bacterium]